MYRIMPRRGMHVGQLCRQIDFRDPGESVGIGAGTGDDALAWTIVYGLF
jgi:hypothetical protein